MNLDKLKKYNTVYGEYLYDRFNFIVHENKIYIVFIIIDNNSIYNPYPREYLNIAKCIKDLLYSENKYKIQLALNLIE